MRADIPDGVTEPNENRERITIATNMRKTITINGVDINEYQKKIQALSKKTTQNRKKTTLKKNPKSRKILPSSDKNRKITAFFSTPPPSQRNLNL